MGIWRAAVIAGVSSISLAGMERDVRAQDYPPLPANIPSSVAPQFRDGKESSGTITGASRTPVPKWRVLLTNPQAAHETRRALDRARVLLEKPTCAGVLTDFKDGEDRALTERLSAFQVDAQAYLGWILFIDGSREELCSKGAIAFTAPGIRVVRLCATEVIRTSQSHRDYIAVALLHEMLHTLGLGENPPASHEITRRVRERCSVK
jgi:hypothetical protein